MLDLGSGSGQDAYLLAQLVGATGEVTGVDATPEQLAVANAPPRWHAERFGFANRRRFLEGDIERLDELDLPTASFDVIVSNCVINLVADKAAVLRAAHRLLKPGGELYFSDVYADRRVPAALLDDPVLHGECLCGRALLGRFRRGGQRRRVRRSAAGHATARWRSTTREIAAKGRRHRFFSATYRLFKLDGLEPQCEDYGQAVSYRGTIAGQPGASSSTSIMRSKRGGCSPSAAIAGGCWPIRALPRTSTSSAISSGISAFSQGAARRSPTTPARDDAQGCC